MQCESVLSESSCMSPRSNWQDVWISYFRPIFPPRNSSVRLHFPSNQIQPQCSTAYLSFCSSQGNGNILFLDFTFFTEYRSHNFCTKFPPRISKRHRAASYLISLLVCFSNSWHWKFIKRLSWFHFQQLPLANEAHNLSTTVIILRPVSNFWLLANCDIELHQWCHAPDCWKLFFYSFG